MSSAGQAWPIIPHSLSLSLSLRFSAQHRGRRAVPAYRVGGIYSRMPDTVRARAKKRIGSLIRDLAHFVPHSGHTYAVASRTSSKFTAREHAVATDPATVQAAPLGSAHLLSPLSFSLSLYACATFLAREEGERERERLHPDAPFHLPAQYAFLLRGRRSLFDPYPFSFSYHRRAELLAGVTRLYSGGGEWRVARKRTNGRFSSIGCSRKDTFFF